MSSNRSEIYTNGYEEPTLRFMRRRTLKSHGGFIEPLIKTGMRILDLGCGPGTITQGLAELVGPQGSVIAVDKSDAQFEQARTELGQLPITFVTMNAYQLEFENESFDGVFSHALFEHLANPADALKECYRVLKPDGFVGLRSPDWGGTVLFPSGDDIDQAFDARLVLQTKNGGNVYAGRNLADWLRCAGFSDVNVTASYEIYPDTALIVSHLAAQLDRDGQSEHALAWRSWGAHPHAMFAQSWFAATGIKSNRLP